MSLKSEGRIKSEKVIMDKIQSILDNAECLNEFDISIHGRYDEVTTIKYSVEEYLIPKENKE